jgi:hypothetical protein
LRINITKLSRHDVWAAGFFLSTKARQHLMKRNASGNELDDMSTMADMITRFINKYLV